MAESIACRVYATIEEDNYSQGCNPDTFQDYGLVYSIEKETIEEIVKHMTGLYAFDDAEPFAQDDDDINRLESGELTNEEGFEPSKKEIELWREDKLKLWQRNYTFYFYRKTLIPLNVNELQNPKDSTTLVMGVIK